MAEPREDEVKEIQISSDEEVGADAWSAALKELEAAGGGKPRKQAPARAKPRSDVNHEESPDHLLQVALDRSREALSKLEGFSEEHAYLVAPNVYRMWEDHLKETVVMLEREQARQRGEAPSSNNHGKG